VFRILDIAPMYPLNRVESILYVSSVVHEVPAKCKIANPCRPAEKDALAGQATLLGCPPHSLPDD